VTEQKAQELAYGLMVVALPAGWIERGGKMTPKAVRFRDRIARVIHEAYKSGAKDATPLSVLPYIPPPPRPRSEICPGHGSGGTAEPCCDRVGEYNGFGSDGPSIFTCPKGCACHD
jgi:hypothetical protein